MNAVLAPPATEYRVVFDFDISFDNGGGLQGQDFRLDIDGDGIDELALAEYLVRDLRLLGVDRVRILRKAVVAEAHRRPETLRKRPA